MAGVSLTVIDILNKIDGGFEKDAFSIELQKSLNNYGVDDRLSWRKTEFNNRIIRNGFVNYDVLISTDTIEEPIYIFDDEYVHWDNGYQKINNFKIKINDSYSKMYIFTNKKTTRLFLSRLKNEEYIDYSKIIFDFSRIEELENLDSAWGSWEDSNGIIRRTGKFGKGLNKIIDDYSKVTTLFIDYIYRTELIQLILSSEGRIYSRKDLSNYELMKIFDDVSNVLVVDK